KCGAQSFRTLGRLLWRTGRRRYPEGKGGKRLSARPPPSALLVLILVPRLLRPRCRTIPLAETLPAPAVASLDEARSEIVTPTVAAYELLCFRLMPLRF